VEIVQVGNFKWFQKNAASVVSLAAGLFFLLSFVMFVAVAA